MHGTHTQGKPEKCNLGPGAFEEKDPSSRGAPQDKGVSLHGYCCGSFIQKESPNYLQKVRQHTEREFYQRNNRATAVEAAAAYILGSVCAKQPQRKRCAHRKIPGVDLTRSVYKWNQVDPRGVHLVPSVHDQSLNQHSALYSAALDFPSVALKLRDFLLQKKSWFYFIRAALIWRSASQSAARQASSWHNLHRIHYPPPLKSPFTRPHRGPKPRQCFGTTQSPA